MDDTAGNKENECRVSEDAPVFFLPNCDEELKPKLGMCFPSFDDAVIFYKVYAQSCGFEIRNGTKRKCPKDGTLLRMYIYCNREGFHQLKASRVDEATSSTCRRRVSYRCGCKARISFVFDAMKKCVVDKFMEVHSHEMCLPEYRKYLISNRKMGYQEKLFNMNCARVNIGPSRAHRLFKEIVGWFGEVGSTAIDWKNHSRDRKAFVHGSDAQIILHKMALKKESCSAFYYAYTVDEKDRIRSLFWADPMARRNYAFFGDCVSFDCTYNTNRYSMIFAPFTGIDNHGKLVTFGAALLPGEDNTLYGWVFDKFLDCMGKSPLLIITDQDPAMKIAVEQKMKETVHRLCMWHIMRKVPEKTRGMNRKEEFNKRFSLAVWTNKLCAIDFEKEWNQIMVEFDMKNERWFCDLFSIRHYWIPAYFRDIQMSGICRTTSISETVNNFFKKFLSANSNLVEFLMHFESAIDAQRETNDRMNSMDRNPTLTYKTPMPFEKHAASIYTISTFYKVQKEIEDSCRVCSLQSVQELNEVTVYEVNDGSDELFKVSYNKVVDLIECSCKKFVRDGLLCSHIFSLFKNFKWDRIPEKYILPRWTRKAYATSTGQNIEDNVVQSVIVDEKRKKVNKVISSIYKCIGKVEGDDDKMDKLMDGVADLVSVLESPDVAPSASGGRNREFEIFYGMPKPDNVEVHPPPNVRTKGSCSRLRDRTEILAARALKPKRKCHTCGEYGNHDSRTCPKKLVR